MSTTSITNPDFYITVHNVNNLSIDVVAGPFDDPTTAKNLADKWSKSQASATNSIPGEYYCVTGMVSVPVK